MRRPGYQIVDQDDAVDDILRPLESSYCAITFMAVLLWIVAALIVGSVIYLSALERVRDFAVFKAVGVSTRSVLGGLALQAVIVAVVAALFGAVLSFGLAPTFPMLVVVPTSAFLAAPRHRDPHRPRREHRRLAPRGHRRSRARVRRSLTDARTSNIHDLVVEYSSGGYAVRPIDGLDLDVPAGSLVILLGPSGCGKTTLLSCLGGILSPTSGEITFGDASITGLDGKAMADYRRNTVGIVFQAFNLVPSLTALENVMVPLRAAGISRAKSKRTGRGAARRRSACRTG